MSTEEFDDISFPCVEEDLADNLDEDYYGEPIPSISSNQHTLLHLKYVNSVKIPKYILLSYYYTRSHFEAFKYSPLVLRGMPHLVPRLALFYLLSQKDYKTILIVCENDKRIDSWVEDLNLFIPDITLTNEEEEDQSDFKTLKIRESGGNGRDILSLCFCTAEQLLSSFKRDVYLSESEEQILATNDPKQIYSEFLFEHRITLPHTKSSSSSLERTSEMKEKRKLNAVYQKQWHLTIAEPSWKGVAPDLLCAHSFLSTEQLWIIAHDTVLDLNHNYLTSICLLSTKIAYDAWVFAQHSLLLDTFSRYEEDICVLVPFSNPNSQNIIEVSNQPFLSSILPQQSSSSSSFSSSQILEQKKKKTSSSKNSSKEKNHRRRKTNIDVDLSDTEILKLHEHRFAQIIRLVDGQGFVTLTNNTTNQFSLFMVYDPIAAQICFSLRSRCYSDLTKFRQEFAKRECELRRFETIAHYLLTNITKHYYLLVKENDPVDEIPPNTTIIRKTSHIFRLLYHLKETDTLIIPCNDENIEWSYHIDHKTKMLLCKVIFVALTETPEIETALKMMHRYNKTRETKLTNHPCTITSSLRQLQSPTVIQMLQAPIFYYVANSPCYLNFHEAVLEIMRRAELLVSILSSIKLAPGRVYELQEELCSHSVTKITSIVSRNSSISGNKRPIVLTNHNEIAPIEKEIIQEILEEEQRLLETYYEVFFAKLNQLIQPSPTITIRTVKNSNYGRLDALKEQAKTLSPQSLIDTGHYCSTCNMIINNKKQMVRHTKTLFHRNNTKSFPSFFSSSSSSSSLFCEVCHHNSTNIEDFNHHTSSKEHQKAQKVQYESSNNIFLIKPPLILAAVLGLHHYQPSHILKEKKATLDIVQLSSRLKNISDFSLSYYLTLKCISLLVGNNFQTFLTTDNFSSGVLLIQMPGKINILVDGYGPELEKLLIALFEEHMVSLQNEAAFLTFSYVPTKLIELMVMIGAKFNMGAQKNAVYERLLETSNLYVELRFDTNFTIHDDVEFEQVKRANQGLDVSEATSNNFLSSILQNDLSAFVPLQSS